MIRAVLFDMDGILYDSEKYYMEGTIAQMRQYGFEGKDEEVYCIIGTSMEETYRIIYELLGGKIPLSVLQENNERYFGIEHPLDYRAIMFDDVRESLHRIRKMNLRTALCSSSPMETIMNSLEAMEIADCFDFVECCDNVERPKPFPDVYLKAQEALGIDKENCIVYEDSALGIQAGKAAGIFTAARKDDRFHQDQSQADLIVNNMTELTEWIRRENQNA